MKNQTLPKRLSHGDKIGVVCPSNEISGQKHIEELQRGIRFFEDLGFEVETGKNLYCPHPHDRAEDINEFFLRPDIKAIISAFFPI